MRCCILVSVMLWYHVEIRDIRLRHMSRWDRYVLRPRAREETSGSETVPHIGPYTMTYMKSPNFDLLDAPYDLIECLEKDMRCMYPYEPLLLFIKDACRTGGSTSPPT